MTTPKTIAASKTTTASKTAAPKTAAKKTAAPKTAAKKTAAPKTAAAKTTAPKAVAAKAAVPQSASKTGAKAATLKTNTLSTPAKTVVNAVVEAAEGTASTTKDTVETAVKAGQDAVAKNLEQSMSLGRDQFEKATSQMITFWTDAADYGKSNVDAYFAAGTAFSKGMEDLGRIMFDASRATIEDTVGATKAMVSAKSLDEVVDLQGSYARKTFDGFVAEGTKLSEMTMKVANQAMAPISERVNVTVDSFADNFVADNFAKLS